MKILLTAIILIVLAVLISLWKGMDKDEWPD